MPVNFPNNPTLNQSYSIGSKTWIWNGVAWDLKKANTITVSLTDDSNNFSNVVTDVKGIRFDANSGFDVTDLGSGNVKIAMNSTFKTWKITGQSDLIANGLDTIEFVGSNGIVLTSNTLSNPKSITFDTSQIFNSVNTVSIYANTPSHVANSAAIYANGAFVAANSAAIYANGAFTAANTADNKATSAGIYANGAFAAANNEAGVNATQNTNITTAQNTASAAFIRANNSLDANNGGTISGTTTINANLIVTGSNVSLGNVGNVHIYGGNTGQLLTTDGTGTVSWIDLPTPNTVTYVANSLIQTDGVYVSGNLWSTQVFGDYALANGAYVLTDGSGVTPAWYIDFDFINVVEFNRVVLNINYTQNSGHTIYVQLYNNSTLAWDNIGTYTGLGSYYAFALQVIDSTDYINSGQVLLRLYHSNAGSISHTTSIDYVALEESYQGPQGPRGPTGSTGATGPAGNGVATGGTTGQVLIKNTATNYDTAWSNNLIDAWNTANSSYVRANNSINANTGGTITGDILITGNLTVQGEQFITQTQSLAIKDNMIYLNNAIAANISNAVGNGTHIIYTTTIDHGYDIGEYVIVTGVNPSAYNISGASNTLISDVTSNTFTVVSSNTGTYVSGGTARARTAANPDLGWAAGYNDGTYHHAGLFRDASDGTFKVFYNYTPEPDESIYIDTNDPSFRIANLTANIITDVITVRGNDPLTQANLAFDKANNEAGVNATQNDSITAAFTAANSAGVYANGAFNTANTADAKAVTAGSYANSAFATANNEAGVNATQNTTIDAAFIAANSSGSYANSAFLAANAADSKAVSAGSYANSAFATANNEAGVNATQNTTITFAWNHANSAFDKANTGGSVSVGDEPPVAPAANSLWWQSNTGELKIYYNDGTSSQWVDAFSSAYSLDQWARDQANAAYNQANTGGGASVSVSDSPPPTPTANSLWWQSNTGTLKIYYNDGSSSQWVDASPTAYSLDQIARDTANAAFIHANAAYNQANTGGGGGADQYARDTANAAFITANAAFTTSNGTIVWNTANAAFIRANNSIDANNGGTITGNLVIGGNVVPTTDNTYYLGAQSNRWHSLYVGPGSVDIDNVKISNTGTNLTITGTSDLVVGGLPSLQSISLQANSSFGATNSAGTYANSAFEVANSASIAANTPSHVANSAAIYANGAFEVANSASIAANTPSHVANSAAIYANGAFAQANTDVTGISVSPGTYGNATYYPVVTIAANGRVESVSTSASGGGGGSSTDQYARNHANSAYGQANTATTAAATAQATADGIVSRTGIAGRFAVNRTAYQNIGSGWTQDFTGSLTQGTFQRMPVGGGHNETDTPNQWLVNKRGERNTGGFGQTTLPYYSDDPRTMYKKFYGNSGRGSWTQREEIYRSETVTDGNVEMIGQMALVHGNDGSNWLDPNVYFNGPTPNTTNTLATQGAYLDSGTTGSVSVSNGEKLFFNINGQKARLTYTTASGWTSGNIDVDDYGGNITELNNDTGSSQTVYYSYYTQGQDTERTFVKIFKRIENSSFSTTSARDKGLNLWNYYWRNDEFGSTAGGGASGIIAPTGSIYFSSQRLHRIWFSGPSKTMPTNSRPYSIAVKMNLELPTGATQNLWQAGDAVNSTNAGMTFTLNTAATGERRVNCSMYSAAAALVTNLKVWQFSGDSAEDVNFHWSWNPLDTVYPGRLYVNNKLVFCTATNPLASGLGFFGAGAMSSGTANGFQGYLNLMTIMPEAWGNHIPQGSYALDWDSTTGLSSTVNNGSSSVDAAARTAIPRKAYIRSSTTFVQGSYFNMENGAPYSTSGSYTASCVTTADSRDVTFSNSVGGWINPSGVYLVTGTNIRTTRNVYTSLTFGDKGFGMDAMDDLNTATASGTTTLTFTRVNGGHYDAWYTTGATINQPGNSTSLSKTNNSAQTLTNCIAGVNSTTYLAFGAFPNITFTAIAGSSGDDTLAGSPYIRTNTSSDAAARNIQGMLGVGKKPSITGAGIPTVSATVDHTYVDDVYWDHYARGAHLIILSQAKTGNATASTYTCVYVPGNRSSFDSGLDDTGGEASIIDSYNYSSLVARTGEALNYPPNDQEVEYGLGLLKAMRVVPPRGFYDSGIFKATAAGFTRRMYLGYGSLTVLVNYGTTIDYNRSTSFPSISYPATAATSNGISVSVSAGNYYRVVVMPLSSIINLV